MSTTLSIDNVGKVKPEDNEAIFKQCVVECNTHEAKENYAIAQKWIDSDEELTVADRVHGAVWSVMLTKSQRATGPEEGLEDVPHAHRVYAELVDSNREKHSKTLMDNYCVLFT